MIPVRSERPEPAPRSSSPRPALLLALILCGVIGAFEWWFLGCHHGFTHSTSRGDLVDSYVEALASGQSHLLVPPAKTTDQPEPDPRRRILDASYFQGRYYLYYGILPFVTVLVPWKLVTGTFLHAEVYIGLLLAVGNLLIALGFARLYRPATARELAALGIGTTVAIICSGSLALMDLPAIHQVESVTGYALNGALFFAFASYHASREARAFPLLVAVTAAALQMACRPNQFPVTACAIGLALYLAVRQPAAGQAARLKLLAALLGIPFLIGAGLAAFNFARFGNPFEFGMSHGTGAVDRVDTVRFSPDNLLYNVRAYLVGGAEFDSYFPFVGAPAVPSTLPAAHEGLNKVYGILLFCPALLLAVNAWFRRPRWSLALLGPGLLSLLYLAGLGFGTYRYTVDFAVFFSIGAGIGCVEFCLTGTGAGRWLRLSSALLLTTVSACGALCVATSISVTHAAFTGVRAGEFQILARPFNWLRYRYEEISGKEPSAYAFTLELPRAYGSVEPLLVTGIPGLQDFVYVLYAENNIRIGFESMGQGGPVSPLIPTDYDRPHHLELVFGSLYPPADHPLFRHLPPTDFAARRNTFAVLLDGRLVFRAKAHFHPPKGHIFVGHSPNDAAFRLRFSGKITRVQGSPLRQLEDTLWPKSPDPAESRSVPLLP